ncbi:MAG: signal recognition particle-docking protein FtsY [Vulcanococcus sp.]
MVFDWFNRGQASQNPDPATPEQPPEPPAAAEVSAPAAATAAPAPQPTSAPVAAPAEPAPAATTPQPAIGAVDEDALAWARQAYARLKAQQEAERQAAAAESAPATEPVPIQPAKTAAEPGVAAVTDAAAAMPTAVSSPVGGSTSASAPTSEEAPKSAGTPTAGQDSAAEAPASETTWSAQVAPEPLATPASQEPAAASSPPAGLSLLEMAVAQRAQRQQDIRERAIEAAVPAASAPAAAAAPTASVAPVAAPSASDEAAPELGAFDADFTWSAEVLAAQGRQLEDISLEEIDWLGRLRRGMEKTRRNFVSQLLDTLGDDPLTPEVLDDLETLLLRADVGVQATDQVLEALRQRMNLEVVDPAEGIRFLKEQLKGLLDAPIQASGAPLLAPERGRLNVWLMVGVNGVGKTTTLGKLANLAIRSGYSCLIAAADTFRAAAVRQVEVWGERSGVSVVSNPSANADPAAVVFDAIGAAKAKGTDLVLVDTAGRLQTKHNLMEELSKVRRIVDKLAPEAAVQSLLVLDASQGQNGLKQAMAFAQAAGLTGVVLTKLDGSSRGGVALAVSSEVGLPIRFIGAGEGIRDLRPFNSFEFVEALLAL